MKGMTGFMLVFVIIVGAFVLSEPSARAGGSAPVWTTGDYWEFETVGTNPAHLELLSEKLRIDVEQKVAIEVEGVLVDSYRCTVTMTVTALFMSTTMTGDVNIRASDLAFIKGRWASMGEASMSTYTPPLEQFRFPLGPGQTWESSSVVTVRTDGGTQTAAEVHAYSVTGPRTVSVRAGTFESFMITDEGGFNRTGTVYYSERAGYVVKTTGNGYGPTFGGELELKSYKYQKDNAFAVLVGAFLVISAVFMSVFVFVAIRRTYGRKRVHLPSGTSPTNSPPPQVYQYPPPPGS